MTLIRGVDCAFPRASYPAWAVVVAGYAGGDTPHVWSLAEVQAVRNLGKTWWAIWTSRNGSNDILSRNDGSHDAAGMIAALPRYVYNRKSPVFYDVEPGVFDNDPTGARLAIAQWKLDMKAAGYLSAYSYTVERQGGDWVANPTGVQPMMLPPGRVGVQYGQSSERPNPFFDYNVFDAALLGTVDMALDDTDKKWVHDTMVAVLRGEGVSGVVNSVTASLRSEGVSGASEKANQILTAVQAASTSPVDVNALAAALTSHIQIVLQTK